MFHLPHKKPAALVSIIGVVLSGWLCQCYAVGTVELFSDSGLYAGEPASPIRMDVWTWSADGPAALLLQANETGEPVIPEGEKVAKTTVQRLWGGWGIFRVFTNNLFLAQGYDYSEFKGGHLRFWLKSTNVLTVEFEYIIEGTEFTKKVGIDVGDTGNQWREIVIPLDSMAGQQDDFNFKAIRSPFMISTSYDIGASVDPKVWYVDHVRWTKPVDSLVLFPQSVVANPGQHRQFTIEGRTAADEPVLLYSTFDTLTSVGSIQPMNPATALGAIFAANDSSGTLSVQAIIDGNSQNKMTASASVTITTSNLAQTFPILNSTQPTATNDNGCNLLAFNGLNAAAPILETLADVYGSKYLKTAIYHTRTDDWSGWTIQWGNTNVAESITKDLSGFYDGSIRFKFMGSTNLRNKAVVGIRSRNVRSGTEISKVQLDQYAQSDGDWHDVVIPISLFAKSRPWADISRVKNLFTITIIGNTEGTASFYISNLRWETGSTSPTSFTSIAYQDGQAHMKISGKIGSTYVLNRSTNLLQWEPILTNTLSSSEIELIDDSTPAPYRFYHILGSP